jgi:hypothetical protein
MSEVQWLNCGKGSIRLDNIRSENYFSVREFEKEKEVMKYGLGINERQSL